MRNFTLGDRVDLRAILKEAHKPIKPAGPAHEKEHGLLSELQTAAKERQAQRAVELWKALRNSGAHGKSLADHHIGLLEVSRQPKPEPKPEPLVSSVVVVDNSKLEARKVRLAAEKEARANRKGRAITMAARAAKHRGVTSKGGKWGKNPSHKAGSGGGGGKKGKNAMKNKARAAAGNIAPKAKRNKWAAKL